MRFEEGFEEALTLHRLGPFPLVGRSLKITNLLESVNARGEQRCGRVYHRKTSGQKHRWLASALLDIPPRGLAPPPVPAGRHPEGEATTISAGRMTHDLRRLRLH